MTRSKSLLIIGGGIIGMTVAREAALRKCFHKITIIEKEKSLGFHASSRNSGIIHAGFYYTPDTQKALFCAEANSLLRNYCTKNNVELRKTGKVVVCKNKSELETINELYTRGIKNKSKIYLFNKEELNNYEPLAKTTSKFLWSPNTWSVNPKHLIKVMSNELNELGVEVKLDRKIISSNKEILFDQKNQKYEYDFIINAAGAHALKISRIMGIETNYALLPFRGIYLKSLNKLNSFQK